MGPSVTAGGSTTTMYHVDLSLGPSGEIPANFGECTVITNVFDKLPQHLRSERFEF